MPLKQLKYLAISLLFFSSFTTANSYIQTDADAERVAQVLKENQPIPDQGNGTFINPLLPSHYHDPTVVRVNKDYYMTHCAHDNRGPIIWHSRDLVNWRPLARIDSLAGVGNIWATDLIHHDGKFYLYLPLRMRNPTAPEQHLSFSNYVITATDPAGPWSKPIDLGNITGIDPGHIVTPQGERFVYVNKGMAAPLSRDGLKATAPAKKVYNGWPIPKDWVIECECLESPKLFMRNDWYYMVSAIGGTVGPSTSHMAIVARSRDPLGPWENDPNTPLLRTWSRDESWWSQGHGTILEANDGTWWMVYHAIPNSRRSSGRNTLMVPIKWTQSGWPKVETSTSKNPPYLIPAGENVGHGMPLSDNFKTKELAIQWDFLDHMPDHKKRIRSGGGALTLTASGDSPKNATRIAQQPVNNSYELTVKVETDKGTTAGMGMLSSQGFVGLEFIDKKVIHPRRGRPVAPLKFKNNKAWLRVRNVDHDVTFHYSEDGINWHKHEWGAALSTESTQKIILYASGKGKAKFKDYQYRGLN